MIHANDTRVAGAIGAGVEYKLADNVGLGGEVKYVFSRGHEIEIEGTRQTMNLDALIAQARLRVLFPEGGAPSDAAYLTDRRWYIGIRYGGRYTVHDQIADGLEKRPALDSNNTPIEQLFAFRRRLGLRSLPGRRDIVRRLFA